MMEAVLLDKDLMEYGKYNLSNFPSIYAAEESNNIVASAVALIIRRADEGNSDNAIYKEVNDFLKRKV